MAQSYDLWFPPAQRADDQDAYVKWIRQFGQPALEIGCGTGRLLLPLLASGLSIEGADPSEEMLAICSAKAERLGLKAVLYRQAMQRLDLPVQYGTIYVPWFTFQLVSDQASAMEALRRFHRHVLPGGGIVVPLFTPNVATRREGATHTVRAGANTIILCRERVIHVPRRQVELRRLRYELWERGELKRSEKYQARLRWYERQEFCAMLRAAGFEGPRVYRAYTDETPAASDRTVVFTARRP